MARLVRPCITLGADVMHIKNIHEAIKSGKWDYEPEQVEDSSFDATGAMPGTDAKLEVLAARAKAGLPLWNQNDRTDYDDQVPVSSEDFDVPETDAPRA